jgi:hypothetical protein
MGSAATRVRRCAERGGSGHGERNRSHCGTIRERGAERRQVRMITLTRLASLTSSLGDSGLLIMRKDQPIYETPVQTHYFNCPVRQTCPYRSTS